VLVLVVCLCPSSVHVVATFGLYCSACFGSLFVSNTYVSLMCKLKKKMERYLRVNLLGPGPRLMKKEFTGPRSHKV